MQIVYKKLDEIKPYEKNPRNNDGAVQYVANSIREFGFKVPIVIDKYGEIVAGHTRYKAAKVLGIETVPCIIADDLSSEQVKAFRLADNKTGELALWDDDLLKIELDGLLDDFDMADFGFDLDLDGILEDEKEIEEDEIPEKAETRCKLGDLWQLGEHRLICGDSTDVAVIDRLMDGVKADMVLTDPPYGTTNISFDKEPKIDFWESLKISTKNNCAKLVFSQQPYTTHLILSNEKEFKYDIIWHKTHSTGFLNAKKAPLRAHEIICVFYKNQPTYNPQKMKIERSDIGRRKTNGTKAEQYNDYQVGKWEWIETGERYPTDVIVFSSWNGARFGDVSNATVHPTQKPLELLSYLLKTYSNEDDAVIDCFGGSGSTLMACEQLNRKCYMCELDPYYCDVIIQRWEDFTGKKAVRIEQ